MRREAPVNIALISDTHFQTNDAFTAENWDAVRRWIAATQPDFVIHLGDITANGLHDPAELMHARDVLATGDVEMLCLPGNHDVGDHAPAGGLHAEEPLGVFLHKPLFRDRADEDVIHTRYVPAVPRQRLLASLQKRDLRFVAAGHTHQMRQLRASGVEHVWVPSTAFTLPDSFQERIGAKCVGIMTLALTPDTHRFTLIVPNGMKNRSLLEFAHVYPGVTRLPR